MKSSELLLSEIDCSSVVRLNSFELVFDLFNAIDLFDWSSGNNMSKLENK